MFGDLPASVFFVRHVRGLAMYHVEIAVVAPDLRAAIALYDVEDADFAGMRLPHDTGYALDQVEEFRSIGDRGVADRLIAGQYSGRIKVVIRPYG